MRPAAASTTRTRAGRPLLAAVLIVGAIATPSASTVGEANRWISRGPHGGEAWQIVIDPKSPDNLLAVTPAGIHRSVNGGDRWAPVPTEPETGLLRHLALDPVEPSTVYGSGTEGLFRSTNGGRDWRFLAQDLPYRLIEAFVMPWDPRVIVARNGADEIYISRNRGVRFERIWSLIAVTSIASSTSDPPVIYAGSVFGIQRSLDEGATWEDVSPDGWTDAYPYDDKVVVAISPAGDRVYVSGNEGFWMSPDRGETWEPRSAPASELRRLLVAPADPSSLLALEFGDETERMIWSSDDGGESWDAFGALGTDSWDVASHDFRTIIAVGPYGVRRSEDGGATWRRRHIGVRATDLGGLIRDPNHPDRVYARRWLSEDSGVTWRRRSDDVRVDSVASTTPTTVYGHRNEALVRSADRGETWQVPDWPSDLGSVWAAPSDPRILYGRRTGYQYCSWCDYSAGGGMYRSRDGGVSWDLLNDGWWDLHSVWVHPSDPQTIFAQVSSRGSSFLQSRNGGDNWAQHYLGENYTDVSSIEFDPRRPSLVVAAEDEGVYRSTDWGETWSRRSFGLPSNGVGQVSLDPSRPRDIYASTHRNGIFRSTDNGRNWFPLREGIWVLETRDLDVDPRSGGLLASTIAGAFTLRITDRVPPVRSAISMRGPLMTDPAFTAVGSSDRTARHYQFDVRFQPVTGGAAPWESRLRPRDRIRLAVEGAGTYCVRARAADALANVSRFGPSRCTAAPLDDTAFDPQGDWSRSVRSYRFGGSAITTAEDGAELRSPRVVGRRFWLLADRCASCGMADVWLGEDLLRRVDLTKRGPRVASVISLRSFRKLTSAVVRVVAKPAGGAVTVDAFAVSR